MSFKSWLEGLFHHVNAHNLAGALAASKVTLDQFATIEKWTWIGEFDTAAEAALTGLSEWQSGQPTTEIIEAINQAVAVLKAARPNLGEKDQMLIDVFVGSAESALAFFG